jgi:uncharacterized protein (TIGR03437 family)
MVFRALYLLSSLLLVSSLPAAHLVYQKATAANLLALDSSGNLYATTGLAITKYDPDGNVLYTTKLPTTDYPFGMTVDTAGNVVLVGFISSDALPTRPGVFQPKRSPGVCISPDKAATPYPCSDAYIVKYDAGGNLAWASYLGGLGNDVAYAVAADSNGDLYVSGLTQSADFPRVRAFQAAFGGYSDAFLTKISADGSTILYSGTLGGDGYDVGYAVAVDAAGSAYLAGQVQGAVPAMPGAGFAGPCGVNQYESINGFLVRVSPGGDRLIFGGCLSDSGSSGVNSIALDRRGNIYLGGSANKTFPATSGAFHQLGTLGYTDFVQKIAADGSAVIYSAVFPGASFGVTGLAVDAGGSVYLSGSVDSMPFPIAGPAIQPCPGESSIGHEFLMHLSPDGSRAMYSSYSDSAHLALARDGSLYLSGNTLQKLAALDAPGDSFLTGHCVLNGASFTSHLDLGQPGISPGEIVTLKGTGLGPIAPPVPLAVNGLFATSLGGTQVLFDGIPAPLLYVQDAQINLLAPYGLAGKTSTSIQVRYNGQSTAPVTIPVSALSPSLFRSPDGTFQVLNSDYSVNAKSNPAQRGKILILYTTGAGQTDPASADGQIWQTIGGLQQSVTAQIRNYSSSYGLVQADAPVLYAGPVPGLVSGAQQFNILIPDGVPDSFITDKFIAGSGVLVQIGSQSLSASIYVQ